MVNQYNIYAEKEGYSKKQMNAIHGNLLDGNAPSSPELNTPEYFKFDLIIMSMALHHVDDPDTMIQKLSERLADGGVLLIVDFVSAVESNCKPLNPPDDSFVRQTISRHGFEEKEIKAAFENAGIKSWGWRWFSSQSKMPERHGGKKQLFMARGSKAV